MKATLKEVNQLLRRRNFNVEASPGKGTMITARVPFTNGKFPHDKEEKPKNPEKE